MEHIRSQLLKEFTYNEWFLCFFLLMFICVFFCCFLCFFFVSFFVGLCWAPPPYWSAVWASRPGFPKTPLPPLVGHNQLGCHWTFGSDPFETSESSSLRIVCFRFVCGQPRWLGWCQWRRLPGLCAIFVSCPGILFTFETCFVSVSEPQYFPKAPSVLQGGGGQLGQHQPFFPHRTRFRKSGSILQSYQLWQMAIGHTLRQNFAPVNGLLSAAFPNRVMISRRMPSVGKPPYRLVAPAAVGQVCAKSPLSVLFCILSLSLPHWARGSCIFTTISFLYGGVGNAVVFAKKFWWLGGGMWVGGSEPPPPPPPGGVGEGAMVIVIAKRSASEDKKREAHTVQVNDGETAAGCGKLRPVSWKPNSGRLDVTPTPSGKRGEVALTGVGSLGALFWTTHDGNPCSSRLRRQWFVFVIVLWSWVRVAQRRVQSCPFQCGPPLVAWAGFGWAHRRDQTPHNLARMVFW